RYSKMPALCLGMRLLPAGPTRACPLQKANRGIAPTRVIGKDWVQRKTCRMDARAVPRVSIDADAGHRVSIAFLNWAHALDHFVMLIFPPVVIGLEVIYARTYSELIA